MTDYLTVGDLSKPSRTPLQTQLEKIDPTIIKHGAPSRRHHRGTHANDSLLFEFSVLAFREIILNRLWKHDHRFQNENEFCKHQWDILKPRKTLLIECAELLKELGGTPERPCSEEACKALGQAAIQLQPSALQHTSIAPELWQRVLSAWQVHRGLKASDRIDTWNISAEFISSVLLPPEPIHQSHQASLLCQSSGANRQSPTTFTQPPQVHTPMQIAIVSAQGDLQSPLKPNFNANLPSGGSLSNPSERLFPRSQDKSIHDGSNSSNVYPAAKCNTESSTSTDQSTLPFSQASANLLEDPRRFHAPLPVIERLHRFFKGPPQVDAAAFEGSTISSPIPVPFPDIMDTDIWLLPGTLSASAGTPTLAPIQSCFLHVPILPSKRRHETETEVVLLDDVRLAGQMNAKLWEQFSNGNILEAITLVPTSATWFVKTELADWPCVVMSGLKFEQANGQEPSGKKYSEVHSYIVVYLGRDPLRQSLFVQIFQDLAISPLQSAALFTDPAQSVQPALQSNGGNHRWIAGFRRVFRNLGAIQGGSRIGTGVGHHANLGQGSRSGQLDPWGFEEDSIDPEFDDIYSNLPPHKKPRLERVGRPSDTLAAWHHNKRRKMDEEGYSKLKDPDLKRGQGQDGSDAEMSE